MDKAPPKIFATARRAAVQHRAMARQRRVEAARFVIDDMVDDVLDRLAFLRVEPGKALVIGDRSGTLGHALGQQGFALTPVPPGFDEERPYPLANLDLVISLGTLDTLNDLPGALIHLRNALAPDGLALAQFLGAGSLSHLRQVMLAADGERPAARVHPMVDVRSAAQLIQRAGWSDPVVDCRTLRASYTSLDRLVSDLRDQGLGSVLASVAPPLDKSGLDRAREAFIAPADADGRVVETFEILALSGRRSRA